MSSVIGVDGCPVGWIAVIWNEAVTHRLCRTFAEVLALEAAIIAVDMPIGFPAREGRQAEKDVRKRLGARQSSVFAVPTRAAVACAGYREACTANLEASHPPKKISKQIFHLFPKMREIDALMTPALQQRVHEVHPEFAFWAMNGGQPLALPKKVKGTPSPPGLALRRSLLEQAGFPIDDLPEALYRRSDVGADDLLDACACAWAARRIRDGEAIRFPAIDQHDARGLRMAISA
ncbi:DUF429 domain-containing protein [Aestuariivirga sp.]|uniref:DUF429 domain-containing protein n=1 Tax=Aestuariivirga sp. TaxID=2650926 RepID=UPI0039E5FBF2